MASRVRALPAGLGTGFAFQFVSLRGQADTYLSLLSAPFYTLIFMAVAIYSGSDDLASSALIAPTLMTLWMAALMFSGEMIGDDRENGRLESLVAAPASFPLVIFGRLCACMLISLPAFSLSVAVAGLVFGQWITIHHWVVFVVALFVTAMATAAAATALSALFVISPGPRVVQNSMSFPIFLFGGVVVPSSYLPDWLEPVSRAIYLSWAADVLRAAQAPGSIEHLFVNLMMVVLLGVLTLAFGSAFVAYFLRRSREQGTLSRT